MGERWMMPTFGLNAIIDVGRNSHRAAKGCGQWGYGLFRSPQTPARDLR